MISVFAVLTTRQGNLFTSEATLAIIYGGVRFRIIIQHNSIKNNLYTQ